MVDAHHPEPDLPSRTQAERPAYGIDTPDRRVRVFVSSTLAELAGERRAAREAITRLHLTPVMFELGARPHPPRELYRAYLAQSDVFVGIYWQRYGWVAPGEAVSGLEDEYRLSGERPKLIYVKTPAPDREERLHELLGRVQADDRASYKPFSEADELTDLLADDLAVLLTERFTTPAATTDDDLPRVPLPVPPTALVGRDEEVRAVSGLLRRRDVRLVTLAGPGGIGKTRLALEVAAGLESGTFDGAWFVDLAAVTDPSLVMTAVASALGIRSEGSRPILDVLTDRLAGHRALLILDNFERVLTASADVARLLAGAPDTTALVTSRTVLHLRGEHEFPLGPLPTPPATADGMLDEVAASPAVQLFVARAEEVRQGFALTRGNAAAVAEICRRLDGIPLAIELAAARVRLLPPAVLLARLGDRLDLHAGQVDLPERQRTLRATLDWSEGLLTADERTLFARLSVFADGWTIEAAEAVGRSETDTDVLETLSALVSQSLVAVDERADGAPRFRMLGTVRDYARERLAERGEYEEAMGRLASHLRGVSERYGAALTGPENRISVAALDAELENLRAALEWAIATGDAELAVRIAAPAGTYWWTRGLLAQMLAFAEQTAALPAAAQLPRDAEALLLWCRGTVRIALGQIDEAGPFLRRLVDAARDLGDDRLRGHALAGLALTLPYERQADEQRAMLREALEIFRRLGDAWGVAFVLTPLGQAALREGDVATATAMHRECLASAERIDNDHMRGQALNQLGLDALLAGDVEGARAWLAAGAKVHRALFDQEGLAYCLDGFAAVALTQGRAEAAGRLLGAATRTREVVGLAVWPLLAPLAEAFATAVRTALGDEAFRRECAAGAALRPLDALGYALQATVAELPSAGQPAGGGVGQ